MYQCMSLHLASIIDQAKENQGNCGELNKLELSTIIRLLDYYILSNMNIRIKQG